MEGLMLGQDEATIAHHRKDILRYLKRETRVGKRVVTELCSKVSYAPLIIEFCLKQKDYELLYALIKYRDGYINMVLVHLIRSVKIYGTEPLKQVLNKFEPNIVLIEIEEALMINLHEEDNDYTDLVHETVLCLLESPGIQNVFDTTEPHFIRHGPFYLATIQDYEQIVDKLIEVGFEPSKEKEPLAVATYGNRNYAILDKLLVNGVSIDYPFKNYTYLQIAAWENNAERVEAAFNRGANTTTMDQYGRVALVLWFYSGYLCCKGDKPSYKEKAKTIPNTQRITGKSYTDWNIIDTFELANDESFSRERLDEKFRNNLPPRVLFDHTPVDYVRGFLEFDSRPSAHALVEYIASLY